MGIFGPAKVPTRLKRARQTAAQKATRDTRGRFAKKHFFEHMFDGIERAVKGVKRVHKTVKRTLKAQPRVRDVAPKRRKRTKKKSAASGRIPNYRQRVVRGLFQ